MGDERERQRRVREGGRGEKGDGEGGKGRGWEGEGMLDPAYLLWCVIHVSHFLVVAEAD